MLFEDTLDEAATKASYAVPYDNEAQRDSRKEFIKAELRKVLQKWV
jgi:hypothetical protein